ncbi:iron ABC transporter substrate-binding protein [methanogenic archaeon mixed culture ISO4-G1]|nr:iron ABC transporter substrate-binding protein [methanogenic archaeon mixed culture ISO4-G1]
MKSKTIALTMTALMVLASFAVISFQDESDAAITVQDGEGTSFTFDGPVNKIITIGAGATATAAGVGALDKIVVCDSYSKSYDNPVLKDVKRYIEEGKIAANGNIYSSGKAQLETDIVYASNPDTGSFDREKDVVIVIVSPSYKANVAFLEEYGFKNVMFWDSSSKTYGDIVKFVETVSLVCNGGVDGSAKKMQAVVDTISDTLDRTKTPSKDAFYITYSGGNYVVGNTKSITTVMIEAAGGTVVTKDDTKSQTTIQVNLAMLKQDHPDAIIFADNTIAKSQEHMNYIRSIFGEEQKIVPLDPLWNNFSIESSTGVWTMACAMYPDLFSGDVPDAGGSSDDMMIYVAGGAVAVIAILALAYFFMRSK